MPRHAVKPAFVAALTPARAAPRVGGGTVLPWAAGGRYGGLSPEAGMAEAIYDKSSKWLLEHQGRGLAFLAGLRGVTACRAVQPEVVQPRQLPDGLLEVRVRGRRQPILLLVEFCTYPEKRAVDQMMNDLMLVKQARGALPEGLALVLCPRGEYRIPEEGAFESSPSPCPARARSMLGWSKGSLSWKVLPLWTLPAEEMLASPDVGVVPWVTLMSTQGPAEPLLRRCRERIDREGGRERANLLAVTQTLMRLRFGQELLDLFGGSEAMIESPLMKEFAEQIDRKRQRQDVADAVQVRFAALPENARASLEGLNDEGKLTDLLRFAITCLTLDEFLQRLAKETTPPPAPRSSRRPRKT